MQSDKSNYGIYGKNGKRAYTSSSWWFLCMWTFENITKKCDLPEGAHCLIQHSYTQGENSPTTLKISLNIPQSPTFLRGVNSKMNILSPLIYKVNFCLLTK